GLRVPPHPREAWLMVEPDDVEDLLARAVEPLALAVLVGGPQQDVELPPVRLPARVRCVPEEAVGLPDPIPEAILEFIGRRCRIVVAARPEVLDELLALRLGGQGPVLFFLVGGEQVADRSLIPVAGGEVPVLRARAL